MPILCFPPARQRLFESTYCPPDCVIPTGDTQAYKLAPPKFRWVYNKLTVAELQGLKCGPHAIVPDEQFPIFSKPLMSLWGMGTDARVIETPEEYWQNITPGHMWCTLLSGKHYSTDIAVVEGKPVWFSHSLGVPGPRHTFDYWEVNIATEDYVQANLVAFVEAHMSDYTGMLNVETIGGKIIEVHLRFTSQWPDLYGPWFLPSLVSLYCHNSWTGPSKTGQTGYCVTLFDDEKYAPLGTAITTETLQELEKAFGVSSIMVDYDPAVPLESWPKPAGGLQLAVINGFDLNNCRAARQMLQQYLHDMYNNQESVDIKTWMKDDTQTVHEYVPEATAVLS